MKEKEKREALELRAKAINLTDEATEDQVVVAEKAAEAKGSGVTVAEQDVRQILHELKSKINDRSGIDESKVKTMIEDAVRKQSEESKIKKEEAIRKGEFSGEDVDPGRNFSRKGKVSSKFRFKGFITGKAPARAMRKYGEELKELQDMNDEILICSKALKVHPKDLEMYEDYEKLAKEFASKALVSTTGGSGDEYVPSNFSAQVVDKVRLELKVAGLHDRIPMLSNPYTLPLEGADMTAYLTAESSVEATEAGRITASTPGTSNVVFTAKKLAARVVFSEEIDEDSIVAMLPYARRKIVIALANAIETCTINGDTTATHMDGDVSSSADARKAWKGYRKLAVTGAKKDAGGDALDAADMRTARKLMGKYGVNPNDLAWVVGVSAYAQMLSEDDSTGFNQFRTLTDFGPQAVILTGQLGAFDGIPVIVSEFVRENLNASGVYDTTTQTRTAIHCVNRSRFLFGDRKQITLKTFEDIQTDQMVLVVKQRLDFEPVEDPTATLVGTVYNILS